MEQLLHVGEHRLIKLRCPLGPLLWEGQWQDHDEKWKIPEIKRAKDSLPSETEEQKNNYYVWMSLLEAVSFFKRMSVCRVKNWQEIRLPGKFVRVYDSEDHDYSAVLSQWYYQIEVNSEPQRVYLTVHQEDERRRGTALRRPYIEVSIAVLRITSQGVELVDLKDFVVDRQVEFEVNLELGRYIILPRTTGCVALRNRREFPGYDSESRGQLNHKAPLFVPCAFSEAQEPRQRTTQNGSSQMSVMFESAVEEIFMKFDTRLDGILTYPQFKALWQALGRNLEPRHFENALKAFVSTKFSKFSAIKPGMTPEEQERAWEELNSRKRNYGVPVGITLEGLKQFMSKESNNDEEMRTKYLENLGYDGSTLLNRRSRAFTLSVQSTSPVRVELKDALLTHLDFKTSELIVEQYGQLQRKHQYYEVLYSFSEQVLAYSYAIKNLTTVPMDLSLDLSGSDQMVTSCLRKCTSD